MNKISFDIDAMKFLSLFESLTHSGVKDCIKKEDRIIFIVNSGEIGKAVGKKGINIKKLEAKFRKKVRIIEYDADMLIFIQNVFYPNKVKEITEEDGIVKIVPPDSKTRGYFIGRNASTLRNAEEIVKRYFDLKEIKIV